MATSKKEFSALDARPIVLYGLTDPSSPIAIPILVNEQGALKISGGGGSQTPWTSDIDAAGFNLLNVDLLGVDQIAFPSGDHRRISVDGSSSPSTYGYNLGLYAANARIGGSNYNGGNAIISGGNSTGDKGSEIRLYTATPGASGTGTRTASQKWTIGGDGTLMSGEDGTGVFNILTAGTITAEHLKTTDDLEVADDILLGSGSVMNWNSDDITLTHSANTLTFAGMSTLDLGASALTTTGIGTFGDIVASGSVTSQEHIITTPDAETEGINITGSSQTYTPTGVQPNTIANLVRWFKADAITGLNDGDAVSTWTDSAGVGNATGTTTTRPLYKTNILNGLPAVRFDGTDDILKIATAFAPQTVFVVFNYTDGATFTQYDGLFTDQGYTVSTGLIGHSGTNDFYASSAHFDELRLNGVVTSGDLGTLSTHKIITGRKNYGEPYSVTWQFGQDRTIAGRFWGGDILEFIAYSRKLKSSEVREVEKYLSDKYGIAVTNSSYTFEDNFEEYYIGSTLQAKVDKLGFYGNMAGSDVYLGGLPRDINYAGVWVAQDYPDTTNYTLLGNKTVGHVAVNAPNAGTLKMGELRYGNAERLSWGDNGVAIGLAENTAPENTRQFTVINKSATKVGQIIKGFTGQTANLQNWTDVSDNVLASVSSAGAGLFSNLTLSTLTTAGVLVNNASGVISSQAPVASGTYNFYNDGVTSGQVTSITITNGVITAISRIP